MKLTLGIFLNGQSGTLIAGSGKYLLYEGKFSWQTFLDELEHCLSILGLSRKDVIKVYFTPPLSSSAKSDIKPIFHLRLVPEQFSAFFTQSQNLQKLVTIFQVTPEKLLQKLEENKEQIKKANVISIIAPFGLVYPEKEDKAIRILKKLASATILKSQDYPQLGFYEREKALLIADNFMVTVYPYLKQLRDFFAPYPPGIYWVENEAVCLTEDFLPQTCGKIYEFAPLLQIARGAAVLFGYRYSLALFKVGSTFKLFQVQNSLEVSELSPPFSFISASSVQPLLASLKYRLPENVQGIIPIFNFSSYYFSDSYPYRFYQLAFSKLLRYIGFLTAPAVLTSLTICKQEELYENKKNLLKNLHLINKKHNFLEKPVVFYQETPIRYLTFNHTILKVGLKESSSLQL
ncbi:MAG TPA: hypothetical protein GX516_10930 [Thermoanaerobacter sp.]|uniref:hypothetical protein n=1 Tax=Thermoanaerobacter sp. A7A TaxID=1350366 RepID=UPI00041BBB51|nr:hypothetical protein [Thermoanaerobacter sp. A7A]MBZ4655495.1 hypothetical protein [Thermoanaerobacter sp.]MDI3501582.1 hypothetical protein [Thermoanaerobacter sp.]MDI3528863.1 hypothetical protein [Thermoanaerobacter sp.]HAA80071.1 hypothetical protein [Thermoanaerobacter sp.]HHY80817.1 hypothetical protein [Thermoanaerobacter sp.]